MSEEKAGGIVYTVDADIRPFVDKMATADKGLDDFGKAMDGTAKSIKAVTDGAKAVGSAMTTVTETVTSAAKGADSAGASIADMGQKSETAAEAIKRIAATVVEAANGVQDLERATTANRSGMVHATTAMEAAAMAAAKIRREAEAAAPSVSKFESQTAKLENKMRSVKKITEEEAEALSKLMARIDPTSAKIRKLETDLDLLNAAFKKGQIGPQQFEEAAKKVNDQLDKLEASGKKASNMPPMLTAALAPLAAAIAGVKIAAMAKDLILAGEQMAVTRVEINRLTGSVEQGAAVFENLVAIAGRIGSTFGDTEKIWARLNGVMMSMGKSQDQVLQLTESLQQMAALGGTSMSQMASSVDLLQRGFINGTLTARQFLTVIQTSPEIGRQLALGMGKDLRDVITDLKSGKVSAEDMFDVLLSRGQAVNTEFGKLPRTMGEAGQAMTTAFVAAISKLNDLIGGTTTLSGLMDKMTRGINLSFGNLSEVEQLNVLMQKRLTLQKQTSDAEASFLGAGRLKIVNDQKIAEINEQILKIQNNRVEAQKKENELAKKEAARKADPNRQTEDGQKEIQKARERVELLKKEGVERAKLKALQSLPSDAGPEEKKEAIRLAIEEFNLTEAQANKKKETRKEETQATKDAAKALREKIALEKEAARHAEENSKAITGMAAALQLAGLKGEDLAVAQAKLKLNKWATPEDVAQVEKLAKALYAVNQTKSNQKLLAGVDPMVGEISRYETELENLKKLNDAKLVENDRYLEMKTAAEYQHDQAMQKLAEADYARQSFSNKFLMDGINALASATTQTLSGLLSGTMNAKEAMAGFANVILNQAVGAIVELGFAQVKQAIVGKTAQQTAAASYAAGVAAQVQATSALAAQATFASISAIPVVGPGMAGPAAAAAAATAEGLGAPAIAMAAASGRYNGGTVDAGGMYRINEGGDPEVFNAADGSQFMMANQRGEVVSNKNASKGGSGMINNITINVDGDGNQSSTGGSGSKEIASSIASVVVNELQVQQRPGGILWRMQNG